MKIKRGNMIYTLPIIIVLSTLIITVLGLIIVQNFIPFIWYQKLNNVALKYLFIVEKFGYMTEVEKQELKEDMQNQGFDINCIELDVTSEPKTYGEQVYLNIEYKLNQDIVDFSLGKIAIKKRTIPIHIRKNSYSKI